MAVIADGVRQRWFGRAVPKSLPMSSFAFSRDHTGLRGCSPSNDLPSTTPRVRVNRHPAVLRRIWTSSVSTVRRAVAFNTKVGTSSDQRAGIEPLAALTSANSACPSVAMRFLTSSTPTPHNKAMPNGCHQPPQPSPHALWRFGSGARPNGPRQAPAGLVGLKRSILRHSACSLANK